MSEKKPDLTQAKTLNDADRRRQAEFVAGGRAEGSVICVNRPGTDELWWYDVDDDVWIESCGC